MSRPPDPGPNNPAWVRAQHALNNPAVDRLLEDVQRLRDATNMTDGELTESWRELTGSDIGSDGKRMVREFTTGATRDTVVGKYEYEGFLDPAVLVAFGAYMHSHRLQSDGQLRASDNWQKGIPLDVYMNSLLRHVIDLWLLHRGLPAIRPEDGHVAEFDDTLGALLFNVQGYWHEKLKEKRARNAATTA